MDQITQQIEPLKQFGKDSIRLVKRCTKPDRWIDTTQIHKQCYINS